MCPPWLPVVENWDATPALGIRKERQAASLMGAAERLLRRD